MRRDARRPFVSFLLFVLTVAAATLLSGAQEVQAENRSPNPDAEADRLAGEIAGADSPAVAAAKVAALRRLGPYLSQKSYLSLLNRTAEQASPGVAFRLWRMAVRVRLNLGDFSHGDDGMEGPLGRQGCLTAWRVVGPFDNNNMEAYDRRLGPEVGESGPYEGKKTRIDWRDMPDFDRRCVYQIGRAVQPTTSAVTYLATEIDVETSREARLWVGAEGAYKIWVNGSLVARQEKNLGLAVDNQAWPVELQKGENRVLVKLASKSQGSLGFVARLTGSSLEPLAEIETTANWSGEVVDNTQGEDREELQPTDQGMLARTRSCARGEGSGAAWCAWLWRRIERGIAATPWRGEAERLAKPLMAAESPAQADSSLSARDLARVSELFERHSRTLEAVERAAKMAPRDPWIALRLATIYGFSLGAATRLKQRKTLERILEQHPSFWPAKLKLADWYDAKGYSRKALEVVRAVDVEDAERRPELLSRRAHLESKAGSRQRAEALERQLGSIRVLNGNWVWKQIADLVATGETEKALERVRRQRELHPGSVQWALKEAELLRVLGKNEEALATLDASIAERPGNVELRRRKAALLVAFGRAQEAVEVLERTVEIGPQEKGIRDFLSYLQPERKQFHDPWMVEDVRKVAEKHPPTSHAHDTPLDQTIVHVEPSGLSKRVVQRVDRANTGQGVEGARYHSVSYTRGDERVDVLDVKIYKSDGRVLEDYDVWRGGHSKKAGPYYNDQRSVNIRANNVEKGDLVEFRYRVRQVANENFRGDYFGDLVYVQSTRPIGMWRYVVESPKSLDLHYREPELEHESLPDERPGGAKPPGNYEVSGFELTDVPAVQTDPRQPGYADIYDYIMVSNKKTWDEVGQWWWNLVEEQLIVNEEIARKVDEVVRGLEEKRAKLEAIHNYVVRNTRYLHVGLGIHGWKPYKTTQCFSNKYGDCKDKSSLLKVMLQEADIHANLVLVRTRDLGTVDRQPASMHIFNHAIVYVPSMDLFLDPTAEFNGTTELTPMDQGAQALVVRDGGKTRLTILPVDEAGDNMIDQELEVDLGDQKPVATGQIVARGQNAVYYRRTLEDPERRDQKFEKQLADTYPGAELISARYEHLNDLERPVEIHFKFRGGRLKRTSNGRVFVFPYGAPKDLLSRFAGRAERSQDLSIRVPFVNETTLRYRLPSELDFEDVPESVELGGEYGSLTIEFERKDRSLVADIRYSIDVQRVPVEDYDEFRLFLSEATSALNETIGLVDKTTN